MNNQVRHFQMECERKRSILRAIEELPSSKNQPATAKTKANGSRNRTKYICQSVKWREKKLGMKMEFAVPAANVWQMCGWFAEIHVDHGINCRRSPVAFDYAVRPTLG